MRPYLAKFYIASVCMAFSAIFDGVQLAMIVPLSDKVLTNKKIIIPARWPPFWAGFVDKMNNTPAATMLNYMAISVLLLFVLKGLFGFLQSYIMSDIGQRVVRDIKGSLYAKLQSLSLDYFTHKRGGEMISRITNDVKLVENAVSYGATDLVYQGFLVVILLFMSFFIYLKMALIAFIMAPFIAIPILKVGRILRKLSRKSQEKMADINSLLYETIIGTRIVKAFNMEDYELKRFERINQDFYRISMKSIMRLLILSPLTEILGCIAGVAVFFWGGREVIA